jgi:hypothetical protein
MMKIMQEMVEMLNVAVRVQTVLTVGNDSNSNAVCVIGSRPLHGVAQVAIHSEVGS